MTKLRDCRPIVWFLGTLLVVNGPGASASDVRDLVFECPCSARWTAEGGGRLVLEYALRSFRSADSGHVVLAPYAFGQRFFGQHPEEAGIGSSYPVVDGVEPGNASLPRESLISFDRPPIGSPIGIALWERVGDAPPGTPRSNVSHATGLHLHEVLTLWPVPEHEDEDHRDFVDILTDTDGDGVGDANERAAGTAPGDPASVPGPTTIDVLAVYNKGFREYYAGLPETRIHHVMVVVNSIFVDNGTNVRVRTVGISEIDHDERGFGPSPEDRAGLMDRHGADLYLQWNALPRHGQPNAGCNSFFGRCSYQYDQFGQHTRGHWQGDFGIGVGNRDVLTVVHELGHVMGLAHSARQGEARGAFRWSRGHYIDSQGKRSNMGTIMSYGFPKLPVFSDPNADCVTGSCGLPEDHIDGANAVASLDLLRFQIAANRARKTDNDADGIVDAVDAFPNDPEEWKDADADGLGDIADRDDDNDGVADGGDAFPLDPGQWADADDDGISDSADAKVGNLAPFRDAALRAAVEDALGKAPGEAITNDDMATLSGLSAYSRSIRDLTGLELATNLTWLHLPRGFVSDLSPLSGLTGLVRLRLHRNNITDLSPLSGLTQLQSLWLYDTNIVDLSPLQDLHALRTVRVYNAVALTDISPLSGLPNLRSLDLTGSWNLDMSQLAEFTNLSTLYLANNGITDLSPLRGLTGLTSLYLGRNNISELSPVAGLNRLKSLTLAANPLADISPLAGLTSLKTLDISMTQVADLTPLADISLWRLDVGWTPLSLDDVLALPHARQLIQLGAAGLGIGNISALRDFDALEELDLADNAILDLGPLNNNSFRRLQLQNNAVSNIAPLIRKESWEHCSNSICLIDLRGNPLDEQAIDQRIPTLESWGVHLLYTENEVRIADPVLRVLVKQQEAGGGRYVDHPITEDRFSPSFSTKVNGFNAGISNLAGLESVLGLQYLFLGSNAVADVAPLSDHGILIALDLSDNVVSDLGPLISNPSTKQGRWINVSGNPLSEESLNAHIPMLRAGGWRVKVDSVAWIVVADGMEATFETADYFKSLLGSGLRFEAEVDRPEMASAAMNGGTLVLSPTSQPGTMTVTVTATEPGGEAASIDFDIALALPSFVPLFSSATDPVKQGFVRVVNRSDEAGAARIDAFDDGGRQASPLVLAMSPGTAVHFNSTDLESGNRDKRITGLTGAGEGDWRLRLASGLDIEVFSYLRTTDGFLTSMHDYAPSTDGIHRIAIFNPASNYNQVSHLRIVNPSAADADVVIRGIDGEGVSPGSVVKTNVAAGASRTFTASDLESGNGVEGELGNGVGKWSLTVSSDQPIRVMSLLESPGGHLTNLSTAPVVQGAIHDVPLFPSASDALGRQGFVRVVNSGDAIAEVNVAAFDETHRDYEPLTLTIDAGHTVHFNSNDLEMGNFDKGLIGSTGAGIGDWRLELTSETEIQVTSFVRMRSGFVTSMHDVVRRIENRYAVPIFNPGRNRNQVSQLRLINAGDEPAYVKITGVDDTGRSPGGVVTSTIWAGTARTVTAAQLESVTTDLEGNLGTGVGKWRLVVESDRRITVMNLLESPTGHLTNLSTAPASPANEIHQNRGLIVE